MVCGETHRLQTKMFGRDHRDCDIKFLLQMPLHFNESENINFVMFDAGN